MVLARKEFVGGAIQTTLNGDITAGSLSITATNAANYPTGAVGKFVIAVDAGLANEEKVLCDSRTSNTFTVNASGRGYDNTSAGPHTGAAVIQHVIAGIDMNDNNDHIYTTTRDDHAQYAKADGTRAFTGSVTFNANIVAIGLVLATEFTASGLTGAVAASRYVGATASGAPSTGTFALGDFVIDQNGAIWICTVAGTPGTWVKLMNNSRIADASVATSETTTSTTYTDLTTVGPAVTVTTGTTAFVTVAAGIANSVAASASYMGYAVSGASTLGASDASALSINPSGVSNIQASMRQRITGLTAGSNTFTAKYRVLSNTGTYQNRYICVEPL